ncbi:MAG TPA: biotin carboxylase N-terminal domain-containing protein [Caulobacteraceae bacterium]|nr:biotin carboxylase N-terminal domain-containing protein [Caulobacteraceae bacterium]
MIGSVLIANRGEIARRIIRTARRLGVATIAVYSEADARSAHVREADVAIEIGSASITESYLRSETILEAAIATGAEAIHPGYGFLSENADFAEVVEAAELVWIGPPPAAIRAMGLKDAAKRLMAEAGVPVTPGWIGENQDSQNLAKEAAKIGWPVLIKAVAGGGGKGMRKVENAPDFMDALAGAKREAKAAFGDDRVLLEKFVSRPRHIEVQIFADSLGGIVHLFERDCSIQRRHQKVIEEAPAPGMDETTRQALYSAAVRAARAVDYRGAGTVEFIADASDGLSADRLWFMEMNTRLQVEHPVTEAITGLDLVEWQLRVASGEPLPLRQDQIGFSGHAIEARLYAEDPGNGFLPSMGTLKVFELPGEVRGDSAVEAGDSVPPYYDPMLAKLISHAPTREMATRELAAACEAVRVWPVRTNAWFLARCLNDADFVAGDADTGFIDRKMAALASAPAPSVEVRVAAAGRLAAIAPTTAGTELSEVLFAFRLNAPAKSIVTLNFAESSSEATLARVGEAYEVEIEGRRLRALPSRGSVEIAGESYRAADIGEDHVVVFEKGAAFECGLLKWGAGAEADASDGTVRSPMPGRIVSILRRAGESIKAGETLLVLEAMKMEHALKAPVTGVIAELIVGEGTQVNEGVVLARIEA